MANNENTASSKIHAARENPDLVRQIHVIGPRPRRRPVTNFLRLTVVAGAIWAGGRLLSGMEDALPGHDLDVVQPSPPKPSFVGVKGSISSPRPGAASEMVEVVSIPIDPSEADDHNDIVRKYQSTGMNDFQTAFQALTFQAEGLELSPYNAGENSDPANITIGVGYHIPSNLRQLGREGVIDELLSAGIPHDTVLDLVSEDPQRLERVRITARQGLSLLTVSMPRYKNDVISTLGQKNWERLGEIAGPEGQAGVVWSAYNGAFWQHADKTIGAIESGDRLAVAQSISGTAKINGKSQENHNLSLARAAVASRETFHYAVGYGNRQGAQSRVSSLIARTMAPAARPVQGPDFSPLPPPDFTGVGQMMASDIVPPARKSTVNTKAFEPGTEPSTQPQPTP